MDTAVAGTAIGPMVIAAVERYVVPSGRALPVSEIERVVRCLKVAS